MIVFISAILTILLTVFLMVLYLLLGGPVISLLSIVVKPITIIIWAIYGVILTAGFSLLRILFVRKEVTIAYDPQLRENDRLYRLFHGIYQQLGCKGQWWVPFILTPFTILHFADISLVIVGTLPPGLWWVIFFLIVGLWGIYLFGEPLPKAPIKPEENDDNDKIKPNSHPPISSREYINKIRTSSWYHGQIAYEFSSPAPDSSPNMPLETQFLYNDIRGLCNKSDAVFPTPDKPQPVGLNDKLIQSVIFNLTGTNSLYRHQVETITLLASENRYDELGNPLHVILTTPIGSGKTTVSIVAALERVLNEHKSVLIVFPNAIIGRPQANRIKNALLGSQWGWAVKVDEYWSPENNLEAFDWKEERYCPDILITSLDFIQRYLLPDHRRWEYFFRQLDLMILENVDQYKGLVAENAKFIFARLKRIQKFYCTQCQVLALGLNQSDINTRVERLIGEGQRIFDDNGIRHDYRINPGRVKTVDDSPCLAKRLVLWNPPLIRGYTNYSSIEHVDINREDYLNEIHQLIASLILNGYKPAILNYGIPITDVDISQLHLKIAEILREVGGGFNVPLGESFHTMVSREGEVIRDDPKKYTACVVLGRVNSWAYLSNEVAHLGEAADKPVDEPLIIWITPDSPSPQLAARNPILYLDHMLKHISEETVPTQPYFSIVKNHLYYSILEVPFCKSDVTKYFGESGSIALETLKKEKKILEENVSSFDPQTDRIINYIEYHVAAGDISKTEYDSLGDNSWTFVERGKPEVNLARWDEFRIRQSIYIRAIVVLNGKRYRVAELKADERKIILLPEMQPFVTIPQKDVTITVMEKLPHLMERNNTQRVFFTQRSKVIVSISLRSYRRYTNFSFDHYSIEKLQSQDNTNSSGQFETYAIGIGFGTNVTLEILHTINHLILEVLPSLLDITSADFGIFAAAECELLEKKPGIVLYENIPGGNGITEWVANNVESVLERAYELLAKCSCTEGCNGCVKSPECNEDEPNTSLDKLGAIEILGEVLDKKDYKTIIENRRKGIDAIEKIHDLKWEVVEQVFPMRLGLVIKNPADVKLVDPACMPVKGLAGLFEPSKNLVTLVKQPEQDSIATLAHEYAHNWQCSGSPLGMSSKLRDSSIVPYYDGKLFVEGFAQWVEFKILDHYGYRRNLDEIVFRHYDEYGEGFLALKWLEDHPQGGVQAVIDFMRTAEVTLGNLKLNVDELLESSRVKARILDMQDRFNRNKPPEDMVDIPDVVRPEPGDENQDEPDVDSEIRNYNWDFIPKGDSKKVAQSISLKINKTRYQQFKNRSRLLVEEWNSYAEEEMPEIENLALEMKKIHVKQHWSTYKQASNVLAFVQSSIKYTSDEESTGHKEWPKYPIETLWEQKGDCEDMAILCASIIARLGFQVVLIVYKTHVAFGVSGADKLKGDYLTDPVTDSKYFYGEATARGYYIGEIPMDFVNIQPEAILKVNILIKDD